MSIAPTELRAAMDEKLVPDPKAARQIKQTRFIQLAAVFILIAGIFGSLMLSIMLNNPVFFFSGAIVLIASVVIVIRMQVSGLQKIRPDNVSLAPRSGRGAMAEEIPLQAKQGKLDGIMMPFLIFAFGIKFLRLFIINITGVLRGVMHHNIGESLFFLLFFGGFMFYLFKADKGYLRSLHIGRPKKKQGNRSTAPINTIRMNRDSLEIPSYAILKANDDGKKLDDTALLPWRSITDVAIFPLGKHADRSSGLKFGISQRYLARYTWTYITATEENGKQSVYILPRWVLGTEELNFIQALRSHLQCPVRLYDYVKAPDKSA